mmetsp:Transcript_44907/g.50717  ORF Transcript_44907/g.50717 Transcript_44907/m.50717 type:complete len:307 (+) Transcript_44907:169-1089(+)
MGSLSKRLGQLTALSLESESSNIIRTMKPNKIRNSLSQRLDTTLKESHDMQVFGLGTLASMANKDRYLRFTKSLYGVYSTMEDEMDKCCLPSSGNNDPVVRTANNSNVGSTIEKRSGKDHDDSPVKYFWKRHSEILRRAELLQGDIFAISEDYLDDNDQESSYSRATIEYMNTIKEAGRQDRRDRSGRLLGHAYTRYLADLMGGSMLGTPTHLALRLNEGIPQQYTFSFPTTRKAYVETIYHDLNQCGKIMKDDDDLLESVVGEARGAFRHNVSVYAEEPIIVDSVLGLKNIVSGYLFHRNTNNDS